MQLLPIFRKSPFVRFLIFFVAGIVAANTFSIKAPVGFYVLTGIIILFLMILIALVQWYPGFHKGWITGLFSGLILIMAGYINTDIRKQYASRMYGLKEAQGTYLLQVIDLPEIRDNIVKTTARIKGRKVNGIWQPAHYKVLLYIEKDSSVHRIRTGDLLWANTRITNIPLPGNPFEFDYRRYMAARNIHKQAYLRSGSWKRSGLYGRSSMMKVYQLQAKLLNAYKEIGLNKTLYSILSAITLGYRNDLEARTKQAFSRAGVMHVMALSGFNVAIIAFALGYLLGGIGNLHAGNVGKTAIIILVIWLFAVVTGLSPSVTRASVMISFVMTGKLFNRHINTHNILFASAFVLLAFSPALLADVSFQLSFAAVWGIIMYQPAMYRIFVFKNLPADRIWKLFTVSCAAQLSTLPLTLYYFHQFPVYFWLANLFIVPLVSVIICIAAVFLLVSVIQPFALVLGKILAILLDFLYRSVSFTEMLPGALIENIRISSQQVILLYTGILLMYMFIHYRKYAFLMSSCVLFLFFQVLNLIHNLEIKNQRIFQVGNVKGSSAICFISGRDCIIWGDSTLYYRQNHMQYALEGYLIERGVAGSVKLLSGHTPDQTDISESPNLFYRTPWLGKNCFFEFSGQRIVWLQDDQIYTCHSVQQLKVDIVIVSGRLTPDLWAVTPALNTDLIILDSSVGRFAARKWKYACKKQGIPCWDVGEKGSYWKQHGKGPNLSKNQPLPSPDGQ